MIYEENAKMQNYCIKDTKLCAINMLRSIFPVRLWVLCVVCTTPSEWYYLFIYLSLSHSFLTPVSLHLALYYSLEYSTHLITNQKSLKPEVGAHRNPRHRNSISGKCAPCQRFVVDKMPVWSRLNTWPYLSCALIKRTSSRETVFCNFILVYDISFANNLCGNIMQANV